MLLPNFSIRKRVTVMMLTVLIVILGGMSFTRLGLEMLPDMDYPIISIISSYQGASSEDIEESLTRPIEQAIASVKDIKSVNSQSSENLSLVTVEFNWGVNLDFAAQDLRDVLDQITRYLPQDATKPLVYKFNLSQMPVLSYGVTGNMNSYELRKILDDEISNRLTQLKGVASVQVVGGDEIEKQIIVDKNRLDFHQISISEVVQAIAMNNMNVAAGHIKDGKSEFLLRTVAQYESLEDIENTPIRLLPTGESIYIKDVATVVDEMKEKRYSIRTNQQPTAYFMVSKESGANTLQVSKVIKEEMTLIEDTYGGQVQFHEIMDLGLPIKKVTSGAASNLIIGALLAIGIMFLFLRDWRPTFAISLAIPISVIATFISMYLARFSLNLMTIGGLALGVGMLVDNSIVVIENIFRHLEMGKDRITAAREGTSEVGMAITASTLTTVAVFFPMVFSEGITGVLVRGLALTVAFSLFASLFVALTIIPVIASYLFKKNTDINTNPEKSRKFYEGFRNRYTKILDWVLTHKKTSLTSVAVLFIISISLLFFIGTDFMPDGDTPFIMMDIKLPIGTTIEETDAVVQQIEAIFVSTEGITNVMSMIGSVGEGGGDASNPKDVNDAQIIGRLKDLKERKMSYDQIRETIRSQLPEIEGSSVTFMSPAQMMGSGSDPVQIKIFGKDLEELSRIASAIEERITGMEYIDEVSNSIEDKKWQAHIRIDKAKAHSYGLTTAQVAAAINTSSLGTLSGIYRHGGEEIDIRVRLAEEFRRTEQDILQINVLSPMGVMVPLSQIAMIEYKEGPISIQREDQVRKVLISASIVGTNDIGGTVSEVKKEIQDIIDLLPSGYTVVFGGSYKDMQDAFKTLASALILAVVLVYLVMASQFESLKQPFIVMFTMPLAAIGVMWALFLSGVTLSVASFVGGIVLAGIVVNNGIILIDHINQLREDGVDKKQAVLQAGADRLRPVLITTLTTVMGMLPMALDTAEGAEFKIPMALTIIGGLTTATVFTLFIIPAIYCIVERINYQKE
ncbi:MAG: efflux RND transporter permease subunit [Candidatus Cloacimonas sp.]|nr:efflux RND transporter permease subunit [Candidatus Cloacimonadota bacterium]